jgi:hypothetical protein
VTLDVKKLAKEFPHMKYSKMRLTSGNILPLVMLIILPIIFMITYSGLLNPLIFLPGAPLFMFDLPPFEFIAPLIRIGILYIIFALYVPYPLTHSTDLFFKRRGFENAVNEYERVKRILYFSIPLPFFLIIFPNLIQIIFPDDYLLSSIFLQSPVIFADILSPNASFFQILVTTMLVIVTASLLRLLVYIGRRDFRYNFAKACFIIISKNKEIDEMQKVKLLNKGLNFYNMYIRRNLGMQINVKSILLKISFTSQEKKNLILQSLYKYFGDYKLEPLKYLSSLLDIPTTEDLVVKEKIIEKIKEWITIITIIIPIIISVFQLMSPSLLQLTGK